MRSRYSAFAKNQPDYLWRTLHRDHPDRGGDDPAPTALRGLRESIRKYRYMGLEILDVRPPDDGGIARVLFLARLFERGREVSFVELSEFSHDGDGWRYLAGEAVPVARLRDPEGLTIDTFSAVGGVG